MSVPDFEEAAARHRAGDVGFALRAYRRLLCHHVADGLLLHLVGVALHQQGRAGEALRWLHRAMLVLGPQPLLLHHIGEAAWASGDISRAIAAHRGAVAGSPDLIESRISLSLLLRDAGAGEEALREGRIALAVQPGSPRALTAVALAAESTVDAARVTAVDPGDAGAWLNLGAMRLRDAALGGAARAARLALVLAPMAAQALSNLGAVALALGEPARAVRLQRRALAAMPTSALHSNLLFTLLSDPDADDHVLLAEAQRWRRRVLAAVPAPFAHVGAGGDAERRLVIGYVSADFRRHPVAGNVVELLERHDRTRFAVNCYAEIHRADAVTERFRTLADRWLPIAGMSDGEAAAAIRRDKVDLLVFLGGHTASNRLAIGAWKPAPIQASFHAPSTTGLAEIDYWLSDAALTPPGWEDRFAERLHRLPAMYAFQAPTLLDEKCAGEGEAPLFGSFNNPGKLNDAVFAGWSRILERVPAARLRLGYRAYFEDRALQRRVRAAMASVADRIEFLPEAGDAEAHFRRLRDVDVVLDTFPFGGATSTFEALWMGVPVVTMAGDRFVGRVGAAICRNIGLEDLVAEDLAGYVERAAHLAAERTARRGLQPGLRDRLKRSSMMDYPRQVRALEDAYRQMWRRHCRV